MTELFYQDGHLSDEGLKALIQGTLEETQRLEAAEHLSFCDDCLVRYTDLLAGEALMEPEEDVTLPVMRRLRKRAIQRGLDRYAAAAAAVAITAGLWYSGVFGSALNALSAQPQDLAQPPAVSQQAPEEEKGPVGQALDRLTAWLDREPQRPDSHLGPEDRPKNMQPKTGSQASDAPSPADRVGQWLRDKIDG